MVASWRVVLRFTYGTVHGPLSTCHVTLLKVLGVLATANVLIIEPCSPANAAQEWVSTPSWDNQVPSSGNGQLGGWEWRARVKQCSGKQVSGCQWPGSREFWHRPSLGQGC